MFSARRHKPQVRVLLLAAFVGFSALVPFSYPDANLVRNLNDISEVCSVLTFTQQIAILTREINKKMKLPAIARLGKVTELLVLLGLGLLLANVIHISAPEAEDIETVELLDTIIEYLALVFVVAFRFYFLATVRGWKTVWEHQKLKVVYYLLFLTHAVPFQVAVDVTGLNWHHVQGLWLRCTIVLCLSSTIRAKLASMTSMDKSKTTTSVGGRNGATFTVGAAGENDDDEGDDDASVGGPDSNKIKKWSNVWRNSVRPAVGASGAADRGVQAAVRVVMSSKSSKTMSGALALKRGLSRGRGSSIKVRAFPKSSPS